MSTFVGLGTVLAIVVVAVVLVSRAIKGGRRRAAPSRGASPSDAADDATGYVPGVWMLGGAESAAPHDHAHGHHHDADGTGGHAPDTGGGPAGGSHGGGGH